MLLALSYIKIMNNLDKSIIMLEKLEALVSSIGGLFYRRAIFITFTKFLAIYMKKSLRF